MKRRRRTLLATSVSLPWWVGVEFPEQTWHSGGTCQRAAAPTECSPMPLCPLAGFPRGSWSKIWIPPGRSQSQGAGALCVRGIPMAVTSC